NLSGRADAVHPRLARLCVGVVVADAAGGPDAPRPWRDRLDEREHSAGPLRLSAATAGTWLRAQRPGGGDRLYAWPDHRLRHPGAGTLALAVRGQYSVRPRRYSDRAED